MEHVSISNKLKLNFRKKKLFKQILIDEFQKTN